MEMNEHEVTADTMVMVALYSHINYFMQIESIRVQSRENRHGKLHFFFAVGFYFNESRMNKKNYSCNGCCIYIKYNIKFC